MILDRPHYPVLDALTVEGYDPNPLFDMLIKKLKLGNDAGLARASHLHPAVISKVRNRRFGISQDVLLRMHDISGLPINDLRQLAGIPIPPFSVQTVGEKLAA